MAVRQEAKRQAQRPWVGWLGRLGLVSMGVSYGIVAVLALELALGVGGKATDRQGALHAVAGHPVGKLLLILLAIGFAGYTAWRIAEAVFNRGGEDDDAKGRVAKPRDAIGLDGALRKIADGPYGPALVGVVAAGLLAYAVYCLVQARYREV